MVPDILVKLELWLDDRLREWEATPGRDRAPTLPMTPDGKVNVRGIVTALGLPIHNEQHFYRHQELRSAVNAAAAAQGLKPVGARGSADERAVANRLKQIEQQNSELGRSWPSRPRRSNGSALRSPLAGAAAHPRGYRPDNSLRRLGMMEVAVTSIISERAFGVIFAGVSEGRKLRFRAGTDTIAGTPTPGEIWRIEGEENATAYGNQVEASVGRRVLSNGSLISRFLAGYVRGIGPERAERLRAAYGESLGAVLANSANASAIGEVLCPGRPLLGFQLASASVRLWKETSGEAQLLAWLDEIGISDLPLARRLYRLAGDAAVERLKANPYALVPLLSWRSSTPWRSASSLRRAFKLPRVTTAALSEPSTRP